MNKIIFHVDGGIGKNITATSVIKYLKNEYPDSDIIVTSYWEDVWVGNEYIYKCYNPNKISYFYDDYVKNSNSKIIKFDPYHHSDYINKNKNLRECWLDICNIKPNHIPTPNIYLNPREIQYTKNSLKINYNEKLFVIHPHGGFIGNNTPYSWARDIPPFITQEIIKKMSLYGYRVIQLGSKEQLKYDGAEYFEMDLRSAMCLLFLSDKRLLIDSFSQHTCAALGLSSTVLWIANDPKMLGYELHDNIIAKGEIRKDSTKNSYLEPYNILGSINEYPYNNKPEDLFSISEIMDSLLK
jgi:hypothetical protein